MLYTYYILFIHSSFSASIYGILKFNGLPFHFFKSKKIYELFLVKKDGTYRDDEPFTAFNDNEQPTVARMLCIDTHIIQNTVTYELSICICITSFLKSDINMLFCVLILSLSDSIEESSQFFFTMHGYPIVWTVYFTSFKFMDIQVACKILSNPAK